MVQKGHLEKDVRQLSGDYWYPTWDPDCRVDVWSSYVKEFSPEYYTTSNRYKAERSLDQFVTDLRSSQPLLIITT